MIAIVVKLAGLAVTVACWRWAFYGQRSDAWNMALIWCAPLFTFPTTLVGRRALEAQPTVRRAEWINILAHYAMMISLGVGIFPAFRLLLKQPAITVPAVREVLWALVVATGLATILTVWNLAWRGLGAPFAVKLSSRLATDWMYGWTRNPMLLATLAWFLAMGLRRGSMWFVLWVAVSVAPGWIFFVKRYEERELEIRFGPEYFRYRERTPLLWPRRPQSLR